MRHRKHLDHRPLPFLASPIVAMATISLAACSSAGGDGSDSTAAEQALSPAQTAAPGPSSNAIIGWGPYAQWTDYTGKGYEQAGNPACNDGYCSPIAVAPTFEVYDNPDHPLLTAYGQGPGYYGSGYSFPFDCDDTAYRLYPNKPLCPINVLVATPTGGAASVQTDVNGVPWWINSVTHHIHYWVPGMPVDIDLDAVLGDNFQWQSVAAGDPQSTSANPNPFSQIWAITTSGAIYTLVGYLDSSGKVDPTSRWFPVPGWATQVAFMNEVNTGTTCGNDWHIPWVLAGTGIYKFNTDGNNCFYGTWQQLPGAAVAITGNDVVLGVSNPPSIWQWQQASGSFRETLQPATTIQTVGAQPGLTNTIYVSDTNLHMWVESCGRYGC